MSWRTYVAVGDSFTEGLDDPSPDGVGYRGWADLVALRLSEDYSKSQTCGVSATGADGLSPATGPGHEFRYANLAVRGRLFNDIVEKQVPAALRMAPDLISVGGGANDVVRQVRFPSEEMASRLDAAVARIRALGTDTVVFRWAHPLAGLPGRGLILRRLELLNEATDDVAARYGARVADLWNDRDFDNPRLWSRDRFHMSPAGHLRIAAHVLAALGLDSDPSWSAPPPPAERQSWIVSRASDVRWLNQHLGPWVKRRLTGRSSGDNRTAKRPNLAPVA